FHHFVLLQNFSLDSRSDLWDFLFAFRPDLLLAHKIANPLPNIHVLDHLFGGHLPCQGCNRPNNHRNESARGNGCHRYYIRRNGPSNYGNDCSDNSRQERWINRREALKTGGPAIAMFAQADAVSATPPCVNDIAG